jgi:hypothetical protein
MTTYYLTFKVAIEPEDPGYDDSAIDRAYDIGSSVHRTLADLGYGPKGITTTIMTAGTKATYNPGAPLTEGFDDVVALPEGFDA